MLIKFAQNFSQGNPTHASCKPELSSCAIYGHSVSWYPDSVNAEGDSILLNARLSPSPKPQPWGRSVGTLPSRSLSVEPTHQERRVRPVLLDAHVQVHRALRLPWEEVFP